MPGNGLRRAAGNALVSLVLALALGVSACGDDDGAATPASDRDDKEAVANTFTSFEAEFHAGEVERACERITDEAVVDLAELTGVPERDCLALLGRFAESIDEIEQEPSKVRSVRVDGDRAVAAISDAGRTPVPVRFVREDGGWKISKIPPNDGRPTDEEESR